MSNPYSIGVGVFIMHPVTRQILIGQRGPACARGAGCLALPGGKVDPGECITQTVLREVKDETDLTVRLSGIRTETPGCGRYATPFSIPGLLAVTDHFDPMQQLACPEDKITHLSLWVMTLYAGGLAQVMEPTKCSWWAWMLPKEIATWKGVDDHTHPQYYWTPMPLWRKILRPYFGEF